MSIGKKIAAIAMAAIMTSTMAISASAAHEEGEFMGYHYDADIWYDARHHIQKASTYYGGLIADIYVGMAVADSKTGITLDEVPRTGRVGRNTTVSVTLFVDAPSISIFSSHEIIPHDQSQSPWFVYLTESSIAQ